MAYFDSIRINEGGHILERGYRNFEGREFMGASRITFCVELKDNDPSMFYGNKPLKIEDLMEDGWNVKVMNSKDPDDPPMYYLQVVVKFKNVKGEPVKNPPEVVVTNGKGKEEMTEQTIGELDHYNITDARMIIRPFEYKPGKISAILKTLYVKVDGTIHTDDDIEDF